MLLFLITIAGFYDQGAAAEFEPKLTGIKCVVSGKAVNKSYSCAFKKGKLFFDCNESRREFLEDKSPFIIKANHQLVVTGQYLQTKCPIKQVVVDREIHPKKSIAGIEVFFCCPGCQDQIVSKANIHEQIRYVFDNRKFNAIFQPRVELAQRGSTELK